MRMCLCECVFICMCQHMLACVCGGQRRVPSVLLYYSLPIPLRQVLSLNGAFVFQPGWKPAIPHDPPVSNLLLQLQECVEHLPC